MNDQNGRFAITNYFNGINTDVTVEWVLLLMLVYYYFFQAYYSGRWHGGIAVSNPVGAMDICLLEVLCVVR